MPIGCFKNASIKNNLFSFMEKSVTQVLAVVETSHVSDRFYVIFA